MIYLQTIFLCTNIREKLLKNTIYNQRRSYINISENCFESNIYTKRNIYIYKTKIIYKINFFQLENLNVEWSGGNSICENFTFGIKIRKCIPNLLISVHGVVNNTKTSVNTWTILFCEQHLQILVFVNLVTFLVNSLKENLSWAPKQ